MTEITITSEWEAVLLSEKISVSTDKAFEIIGKIIDDKSYPKTFIIQPPLIDPNQI